MVNLLGLLGMFGIIRVCDSAFSIANFMKSNRDQAFLIKIWHPNWDIL